MAIRTTRQAVVAGPVVRALLVLVLLELKDDADHVGGTVDHARDLQREHQRGGAKHRQQERQASLAATTLGLRVLAHAASLDVRRRVCKPG